VLSSIKNLNSKLVWLIARCKSLDDMAFFGNDKNNCLDIFFLATRSYLNFRVCVFRSSILLSISGHTSTRINWCCVLVVWYWSKFWMWTMNYFSRSSNPARCFGTSRASSSLDLLKGAVYGRPVLRLNTGVLYLRFIPRIVLLVHRSIMSSKDDIPRKIGSFTYSMMVNLSHTVSRLKWWKHFFWIALGWFWVIT
jgi:hypothetical protein